MIDPRSLSDQPNEHWFLQRDFGIVLPVASCLLPLHEYLTHIVRVQARVIWYTRYLA